MSLFIFMPETLQEIPEDFIDKPQAPVLEDIPPVERVPADSREDTKSPEDVANEERLKQENLEAKREARKAERGEWRDGDIRAVIAKEHGGKSKEWGVDDEVNISGDSTYFNEADGKIYDLATDECLTDKTGKGSVNENENFRKADEEMRKGLAEKGSYTFKFVDEKGTHITFVRLEGQNNEIKYSYYLHPEKELVIREETDDGYDDSEIVSTSFDGDSDNDSGPLVIDVNAELREQMGMENASGIFSDASLVNGTNGENTQVDAVDSISIAPLFETSHLNTIINISPREAPERQAPEEKVQGKAEIFAEKTENFEAIARVNSQERLERESEEESEVVEVHSEKKEEIIEELLAPEVFQADEKREPVVFKEEGEDILIPSDLSKRAGTDSTEAKETLKAGIFEEEQPSGIELVSIPEPEPEDP
ncbi:MAG: hypothetical protein PHN89_03435 [Candidatus Pacebacteria bacterium]|nr:hypothetical protein [Candidatus Paceibacterota bacterium]